MNARLAYRMLAAGAALLWLSGTAWLVRSQATGRLSDFAAFYAAGRLVGTGQLYDAGQLQQIERESTGRYSPAHGFVRPPFHALLFSPPALLPYHAAEMAWAAVTLIALLGFVTLWPALDTLHRWVLVCLSLPAAIGLANGQDSALILVFVTLAVALCQREQPFTAGIIFSICSTKAHLFLLLPLLILRLRAHRFGAGILAASALLAAISAMIQGWPWPVEMWNAATNPAFTPNPGLMPNFAGVFEGSPAAGWIYTAAAALLGVTIWCALPRTPFPAAFALTVAASLPLAPHSYLPDCILLLPAICEAIQSECPRVRWAGFLIATPLPFLAPFLGGAYSRLALFGILALVILTSSLAWGRTVRA